MDSRPNRNLSRIYRAKSEIRDKYNVPWASAAVDVRNRIASFEFNWPWAIHVAREIPSSVEELNTTATYPFAVDRLCDVCQSITCAELLTDEGCMHHRNGTALIQSAIADECRLCMLILESFSHNDRDSTNILLENDFPIWLRVSDFHKRTILAEFKHTVVVNGEALFFMSNQKLEIFDEYTSRGKSQILEFIGENLRQCLHGHTECRRKLEVTLPKRLIDVGNRSNNKEAVRLWTNPEYMREDVNQNEATLVTGVYAALSYCWGREASFRLTPETIEDFQKGIPLQSLPQTLRDAIEISYGLGIQYLWVDALCIMQGPSPQAKRDWAQQSVHMDEIYGQAAIVLGAASSTSADTGIVYHPYQFTDFVDTPVHWTECDVFGWGRKFIGIQATYNEEELGPLHSRGWAFQERILAAGFAHIGRETVFFECNRGRHYDQHKGDLFKLQLCPRITVSSPPFEYWHALVEEYSKRSLTVYSDNLIALAGVAKRFSLNFKSTEGYMAGLWKGNLIRDLLWYLPCPSAKLDIAPSWSWASTKSEISYERIHRHICLSSCASIVSSDIAGVPDLFGHRVKGQIIVRGYLRKIFVNGTQGRFHITGFQSNRDSTASPQNQPQDSRHRVGKCFMDSHNAEESMCPVAPRFRSFGLEDCWDDLWETWCLQLHTGRGILLKAARRSENQFERIGYYEYLGRRLHTDHRCREERAADQTPLDHAAYFVENQFRWMEAAIQAGEEDLIEDWFGDPDSVVTLI